MINNFSYITADNVSLRVDIGLNTYLFEGCDDTHVMDYYNSRTKGVKWTFQNQLIEILEEGQNITGYPSHDLGKVVVIYPIEHATYPAPNNAVIYNPDGSIHLQLKTPNLISEIASQRKMHMDYVAPFRLYYESIYWAKNEEELVTVVKIGFDREWTESRILNVDSGELGVCLNSGRR